MSRNPCSQNCMSHDLTLNALFNYLRSRGWDVYVDVPIPAPSQPSVTVSIQGNGSLVLGSKKSVLGVVDLVALRGGKVVGYEVKASFSDVVNALSSSSNNQLLRYADSGFFDEFYLVVPEDYCGDKVCDRVVSSYGKYLWSTGIGLICVDCAGNVNRKIGSQFLSAVHSIRAYLPRQPTQGHIKQLLINYLRSVGYGVYTEVYIPKPAMGGGKACYSPTSWLNRIDVVATNCTGSACGHTNSNCCIDIIGVEITSITKPPNPNQLMSYLHSGALTEVWAATASRNGPRIPPDIGLITYNPRLRQFNIIRRGRRVSADICALVLIDSNFKTLTVYSFLDLCCQKKRIDVSNHYATLRYGSVQDQKNIVRNTLTSRGIIDSNCKVIFIRRSRKGRTCYPIVM